VKRKQRKQRPQGLGFPHSEVRSAQDIMPDEMLVTLGYPLEGQIADASTFHSAKRWQVNAAYDVDPILGSTSTPGFSEWAALYTYYRVIEYYIIILISNLDTQPYELDFVHSNEDPGNTGLQYHNYASQPYCSRSMIAAKGGMDRATYHKKMICAKLLGSVAIETSDTTRALVNAVPADLLYFGVGVRSLTATNQTNGVVFTGSIRMRCRFYGRQNLLTTFKSINSDFEKKRLERKKSLLKLKKKKEEETVDSE